MPTFQILAKTLKRTKLRLAYTFPCTSCIFVHPNLTMLLLIVGMSGGLQHYEKQKQETEKEIGLHRNWDISHVVASFVTTYIILYNWWSEFACNYQKHSIPKHLSIDTVTMLLHINMCHIDIVICLHISNISPFQNIWAHTRWRSGWPYLRDESVSDVHL